MNILHVSLERDRCAFPHPASFLSCCNAANERLHRKESGEERKMLGVEKVVQEVIHVPCHS